MARNYFERAYQSVLNYFYFFMFQCAKEINSTLTQSVACCPLLKADFIAGELAK
jgi:hypothetical protein